MLEVLCCMDNYPMDSANLALCVNPQFIYVYLKDPVGTVFIVAKSCISVIPGAMNKKKKLSDGWQICKEVAAKS